MFIRMTYAATLFVLSIYDILQLSILESTNKDIIFYSDRVAAAHLRPLDKKDFEKKAKKGWNQYATNDKETQEQIIVIIKIKSKLLLTNNKKKVKLDTYIFINTFIYTKHYRAIKLLKYLSKNLECRS